MVRNKRRALNKLVEKSEDCADLAKSQRADADKAQAGVDRQHESAHKLEILSQALADDAAEIKEELAVAELETPPLHEPDGDTVKAVVPK